MRNEWAMGWEPPSGNLRRLLIRVKFLISTEIKFSSNYAITLTGKKQKEDTESLKIEELYEFLNDSSRG